MPLNPRRAINHGAWISLRPVDPDARRSAPFIQFSLTLAGCLESRGLLSRGGAAGRDDWECELDAEKVRFA